MYNMLLNFFMPHISIWRFLACLITKKYNQSGCCKYGFLIINATAPYHDAHPLKQKTLSTEYNP